MNWRNVGLIFRREVLDQLRDRRTLFMILVLPVLLYPAMGIGMVQLTVLFSEQPRTVVVIGAEALPAEVPLLDGSHFVGTWFRNPEDAQKLVIVSDAVTQEKHLAEHQDPTAARHFRQLDEAHALREPLERYVVLESQLMAAQQAGDQAAIVSLDQQRKAAVAQLHQKFATSDIQVLLAIPPDFAENLRKLKSGVVQHLPEALTFDYPRPILLHNGANEKSTIAFTRVERVLAAWEQEILRQALQEVGLPSSLPAPVRAATVNIAAEEELSANIWSKLFPALLIMMALTGAFYPSIDLGAGEKERGTMETLLICPATRTEIVVGKFLTVMLFSASTALLNLSSLGFTGKYMISLSAGTAMTRIGDLGLPPWTALAWVLVALVPLSSLFSALCLALATFAKSSKEGQYYLTPLLMVTLGLTMFCLSPAVEMQPFYSVMPVMGPALLLKGLLQANHQAAALYVYVLPVLLTSLGYSILALWWAIDQFGSEDVLFREAERFDLRLWIRHLLRDKESTPSFSEAMFAFVFIMLLQFLALRVMQEPLQAATPDARALVMIQMLIVQQLVIIATPPLIMGVMLTTSVVDTFRLRVPRLADLLAALALALTLHPLTLEAAAALQWFFPPLPPSVQQALAAMTSAQLPWWLPFLAFAVAPAICEELAFRGFLLSGFERSGRERLAIMLSGLAFGIIHMIPQQVLNAAVLGMVLGLIAVRTRSLLPGVLFHLLYNGLEVFRSRYGAQLPVGGPWAAFFRKEDGLRYQPLLLLLCGAIGASVLLWLAYRRAGQAAANQSSVPHAGMANRFPPTLAQE